MISKQKRKAVVKEERAIKEIGETMDDAGR